MSQRDHSLVRDMRGPARRPPCAEAIVAEAFAQRSPIAATKALAHGLTCQTPGAQLAALRIFVEALCRRTPKLADDIARELRHSVNLEVTP